MSAVRAFEGAAYKLHRYEEDAVIDIIFSEGEAALRSVLMSDNPEYRPELREAIARAAEMLKKPKRKKKP